MRKDAHSGDSEGISLHIYELLRDLSTLWSNLIKYFYIFSEFEKNQFRDATESY
jgi:hypothetical protein